MAMHLTTAFTATALTTLAFALPGLAHAQAAPATSTATTPATAAPFTLPDLPYGTDALAPVIDQPTMELHHGKHHKAYVDNLNTAIAAGEAPADLTLEQLVAAAGTFTAKVRNNAGGHWNHSFFWETMAPPADVGTASTELGGAIDTAFGSLDEFKTAFEAAGVAQFGSGWVWLIVNEDDQLEIVSTPNQDNPLMDIAETKGTPILGNDVWEHAYYLTYNNRRPEYLSAWWKIVDWETVSTRYDAALAE